MNNHNQLPTARRKTLTKPVSLDFIVGGAGQGLDAAVRIRGCDNCPIVDAVAYRLWKTWQAIPTGARRAIISHWAKRRGAPHFSVLPFGCGVDVAEAWDNGCSVELVGPVLARMPTPLACAVISHEFAHCWQRATGLWLPESIEPAAHQIAIGWGFPIPEASDHLHWYELAVQLAR